MLESVGDRKKLECPILKSKRVLMLISWTIYNLQNYWPEIFEYHQIKMNSIPNLLAA